MIPCAQKFLKILATATNIGNHPVDIGLVQFCGMNVMVPSQLVVFQRLTRGGELYHTNFSTQLSPQQVAGFQRGIKPSDHYGFPPRFGLPPFAGLGRNRLQSVGTPFEDPFKFWRSGRIGQLCQDGCLNDTVKFWDWCSRGCPLEEKKRTMTL